MHNSSILSVFVCYYRQCSECDPSDDDDEMEVDTEDTTPISQGRQRRVIKEPTKFTPDKGEVSQVASGIHVANYSRLLSREIEKSSRYRELEENSRE